MMGMMGMMGMMRIMRMMRTMRMMRMIKILRMKRMARRFVEVFGYGMGCADGFFRRFPSAKSTRIQQVRQ